jgi:hypothetical protein
MVYASLEAGATGIFFWTWYRSDPRFIELVIVPIAGELAELDPALRAGTVETGAKVDRRDVGLTMFADPTTDERVIVLVHHGGGEADVRVTLDDALRGARVESVGAAPVETTRDEVRTTLGPFGVKVLRLRTRSG